jgi:hypothetical protein
MIEVDAGFLSVLELRVLNTDCEISWEPGPRLNDFRRWVLV